MASDDTQQQPGMPQPSPPLAEGLLIGREAWVGSLRDALQSLATEPMPPGDLLLWSADFTEWPLDEAPVLQALTQWLRPAGRQLRFIARDYGAAERRHPRLARWRRDWSHRVEAWAPTVALDGEPAGLLLSGTGVVQLLDAVHWRAKVSRDAPAARAWREQCESFLQRCEPAWPITTLGL